jgi:hypothetical protein
VPSKHKGRFLKTAICPLLLKAQFRQLISNLFLTGVIRDIQLYLPSFERDSMKFEEQKSSGREKDEASIELLRQLTRKLCSNDITTARLAAFNLSWMQEDGLAILTEVLLGDFSRTTKKAAAYGLRSMKGRMKKMATEVLEQGLKHRDRTTKAVCVKALALMKGTARKKGGSPENLKSGKSRIEEIQNKNKKNGGRNKTSSGR